MPIWLRVAIHCYAVIHSPHRLTSGPNSSVNSVTKQEGVIGKECVDH